MLHGYLASTPDSTCLKFCPLSNLYLFDFLLVNGAILFDSLFRSPHPQHPALTKHYQVCLLDVSVMHPSLSNLAISALAQTFTISHLDLTNSLLAPFELIIQRFLFSLELDSMSFTHPRLRMISVFSRVALLVTLIGYGCTGICTCNLFFHLFTHLMFTEHLLCIRDSASADNTK